MEGEIKCPSCADLSIAQSDAAAALDLRAEVTRMVDAGASDAAVERRVVAEYGSAALPVRSGSGVDVLVWVVPSLVVAAVALGLGIFLWRRLRGPAPAGGLPSGPVEEDEALVEAARRAASGEGERCGT